MSVKKRAVIISCFIGLLLAASIASIIVMKNTAKRGKYAYIYQNDRLIKTVDLYAREENYSITVEADNGGYNVVEVRNGSIGITEATCPDGLCIQMGFIDNSLLPVTCLPNHLVIRVENEGVENEENMQDKDEIDGIAR